MDLNKVMLIGNLTRDPEIRQTAGGQTVANFALATNLVWLDQSGQKQTKAEFHNIVAWRKLGEICGQYLHRGSKIYLEGRLQTRNWLDKDNNKRYTTEIIADNMIMLDRSQGAGGGQNYSAPASANSKSAANNETVYDELPAADDFSDQQTTVDDEIKVESIPF